MLEHDIKKTSVFDYPKNNHWDFELIGESDFKFPFPDTVMHQVARYYADKVGGPAYNSPCVCIENVQEVSDYTTRIALSTGDFYHFLLANVIGREAIEGRDSDIVRTFKEMGAPEDVLDATVLLGRRFKKARNTIESFTDCCRQMLLPNVVALSIFVRDKNDNFLVSQRTSNVVIAKNMGGVTSTGTLELMDCVTYATEGRNIDPFCAAAQRELAEETEFKHVADSAFTLRGLMIGQAKLQPVAIVDVVVDEDLSGYMSSEPCGSDESEPELARIMAVPREYLQKLVFTYDMTEAASYHMLMHA